jgi:hypothetical protein
MKDTKLKTMFLTLLKTDKNFRMSVIDIIQPDLINHLDIDVSENRTMVNYTENGCGDVCETEVVESIGSAEISFNNFSIKEDPSIDVSEYEKIISLYFSPFLLNFLSKERAEYNLNNIITPYILSKIRYSDIPSIETFTKSIVNTTVKISNADITKNEAVFYNEYKRFISIY